MLWPSRRSFLETGALFLGSLAGCLGPTRENSSGEPTNTATPTPATETTESPTSSYDVDVNAITVVPELVAFNSPDSIGTFGERDEQFVVASVESADEYGPGFSDFELVAADDAFYPASGVDNGRYYRQWPRDGGKYTPGGSGELVFRLPKPVETASVTLEWPGGWFAFDATETAKITRLPTTFEILELSTPERVGHAEDIQLTLEIENTGSVDGTFVGALNRTGPNVAYTPEKAFSVEIPAEETETWSYTYEPPLSVKDGNEVHFKLAWRDGREMTTTEFQIESS